MTKYGIRIVGLLMSVALLCSGCGGTDDGTTTTTDTTTTTIPTTTTTLTPTSTQKAEAASGLLVNCPDGKQVDSELLARLKAACSAHKNELSFYYKDLVSGYSIEFRADQIYQTASVIKAPYVRYLLETVNVDLNKKLKMTKKQGGSSHIDDKPMGTEFTVKELMEYAIRYSDNTAYYMLNEEFGFAGFNAYADMLGIRANATNKLTLVFPKPRFGYLSARDAGLYFEDIAKYIEQGSENAKMLKSWLTTTTVEGMLAEALGDTYEVAHKYGEQGSQAYHDAAIVYAPQPYVLSILSTLEPYADESNRVFSNVATLIDAIQTQLHA